MTNFFLLFAYLLQTKNAGPVPVGDVEALADRIRKLAENPKLREKMGKAAQSQLADKYSMKAMVAKHVELYRQIEPGMVEI